MILIEKHFGHKEKPLLDERAWLPNEVMISYFLMEQLHKVVRDRSVIQRLQVE